MYMCNEEYVQLLRELKYHRTVKLRCAVAALESNSETRDNLRFLYRYKSVL